MTGSNGGTPDFSKSCRMDSFVSFVVVLPIRSSFAAVEGERRLMGDVSRKRSCIAQSVSNVAFASHSAKDYDGPQKLDQEIR